MLWNSRYAATASGHHEREQQEAADIAANMKTGEEIEVWRSLKCMDKDADLPFERVKRLHNEDGKTTAFKPFYNEEGEEQDSSDEEDEEEEVSSSEDMPILNEEGIEVARWCPVRRNGEVGRLGNSLFYVGQRFVVRPKPGVTTNFPSFPTTSFKDDGEECAGIIRNVCRNKHVPNGDLHFHMILDGDNSDGCLVPCKDLMSASRRNPFLVRINLVYYILFLYCLLST
jgi:hypothetical protein